MTPPTQRIDHIGIVVADFDAHVAQLEALGLELRPQGDDSESHVRHYRSGDASVELIDVLDESARRSGCRAASRRASSTSRSRSRASRTCATLEARGVEVSWPPSPSASGR